MWLPLRSWVLGQWRLGLTDRTIAYIAGEIRFELYPEKALKTVANFLKYIDGGHLEAAAFIERSAGQSGPEQC